MGEISKMEADLSKKHQEELEELKENDTPSSQPESQVGLFKQALRSAKSNHLQIWTCSLNINLLDVNEIPIFSFYYVQKNKTNKTKTKQMKKIESHLRQILQAKIHYVAFIILHSLFLFQGLQFRLY